MLEGSREVEGDGSGFGGWTRVERERERERKVGQRWFPRINTAAGRPPPACSNDRCSRISSRNRMPFGALTPRKSFLNVRDSLCWRFQAKPQVRSVEDSIFCGLWPWGCLRSAKSLRWSRSRYFIFLFMVRWGFRAFFMIQKFLSFVPQIIWHPLQEVSKWIKRHWSFWGMKHLFEIKQDLGK